MPATSTTTAAIDAVFSDWSTPGAPGVAVGVVRAGEPVYTRCFGLASVEHDVPIGASTLFDIASMTKQFTAFATLLLVREGKLSLGDDVRVYLPDLPAYDPPVRIGHCLYHTCGLTDWLEALELAGPTSDFCSNQRAFRTIVALRDTIFPSGSMHSYTNTGYVLLGWIVAKQSGKPLGAFLKERVFDPLGMSRSMIRSDPRELVPGQAQGYLEDADGRLLRVSDASEVCGDGGMLASVADMIRWLQNLARREVGDDPLFELLLSPGRLDDGRALRYAAGWVIDRYRGFRSAYHGGLGVGFQSIIFWLPDAGIGVTVLGNLRPYLPWRLATGVVDVLLAERRDGRASPPSQTPPRQPVTPAPEGTEDDLAEDLAGRYFTETGLPVLVERHQEQVRIDIWLWRRRFGKLRADVYREEHSGDTVSFHRDAGGVVTHFTMQTEDGACPHMHGPIAMAVKFDYTVVERTALARLEGRYASDEVESTYAVTAGERGLIARHLRCHDWNLLPIKAKAADAFEGDFAQRQIWPGKVTFEPGPGGSVSGFRVRGCRVNLFFRKLPAGA